MITYLIQCPHCRRKVNVHHMVWDALVCMSCGRDVKVSEWHKIGQQVEYPTKHPLMKRVIAERPE
jgi:hypothetical protein